MSASQWHTRVLAIDFGTKRLGLAVSDALGITAQGLPTRERTRLDDDLKYLEKVVAEHSVERVILGNPLGQSGGETAMSARVAAFAEKLRGRLKFPVELWDERMTSAQANRMLRESGIGIEKRRRAADRVAATLLLQGYLDYQASQKAGRAIGEAGASREADPPDSPGSGTAESPQAGRRLTRAARRGPDRRARTF